MTEPKEHRARSHAWLSLVLAAPELLTVLGIVIQHALPLPGLADVPEAVGRRTFFLATAVLGALAALFATLALARGRLLPTRHRLAAWTALVFGGGQFLVLMVLQLFTKELQPF